MKDVARERKPERFPRRVLVAAAGLTPQVVTETVYALAVARQDPFLPTEVHLITTAEGAERARLSLLGGDPGWFQRLRDDYRLPEIRFTEADIHVLLDAEGRPLADIRTEADNEAAADQITTLLREFTADEDAAVHVSMAGGRKTLGFFLAYALSLLGRPQDRLSHVLVTPPFESHPEFYYPTPSRRVIYTPQPDSRPLDTSKAKVSLAEIPFVRLRDWLPEALLERASSYHEAVEAAQRSLGPPSLVFDPASAAIEAGGVPVKLTPAQWAFYSWLARRKVAGKPPVRCPNDGAPEPGYAAEYLVEYEPVSWFRDDSRTRRSLKSGMEKRFFLETKSRLHRVLKRRLGKAAAPYLVQSVGKRPETGFELAVDPERIQWKKDRR